MHNEIGLQSSKEDGLFSVGIRVINIEFKPMMIAPRLLVSSTIARTSSRTRSKKKVKSHQSRKEKRN